MPVNRKGPEQKRTDVAAYVSFNEKVKLTIANLNWQFILD